jgi:hypothetical protein
MNKLLLLFTSLCFSISLFSQGVGVNNTGANPNPNAILDADVSTNDKGILIPRISTGQRTGIGGLGATEEGLTVYDETTNSYWLWDGTQWIQFLMQGKAWELAGNGGTTPGTDFIGTTDAQDWVIKTNNTERVRVLANGDVDLSDNTLFERNTAGNTYGMGMNVNGGTELVFFSDNLIDFTESDGNTQVMQIQANTGRVEMFGTTDASGTANSGVLEIANSLRIDGNEIITNTNTPLFLQNDNNGDLNVDGSTFAVDASTNRVGIGTTAPGYPLHVTSPNTGNWQGRFTNGSSNVYLAHETGYGMHINTGGTNSIGRYALEVRNATQTHLYVREDGNVGVGTAAPSTDLDVNGTVRIRGGGPSVGALLMANNVNGTATWATSGYGMVPIGSIVAWHKNAAGVPGLPAGWVECNGGTSNGIAVPNLNGATTSTSGDASRGRFLRGNTTSGAFQADVSNNLDWVNHDDSGNGDAEEFLNDDGTTTTIRNYSTSGDRFQVRVKGVETRVVNMSVVWIMRTQ